MAPGKALQKRSALEKVPDAIGNTLKDFDGSTDWGQVAATLLKLIPRTNKGTKRQNNILSLFCAIVIRSTSLRLALTAQVAGRRGSGWRGEIFG